MPSLTAIEEAKLRARLDQQILSAGQILACHGEWTEFILNTLGELQSGRERAERILTGAPKALAQFPTSCGKLSDQIRRASARVQATYYALATEEILTPFFEPGCRTSPLQFLIDPESGRLEITVDPNVIPTITGEEDESGVREKLNDYIAAQVELKRLLYHVPFRPNYMLESSGDFQAVLVRYARQVEGFRTWQTQLITSEHSVFNSHTSDIDDMHRKALWSAARGARLFPADILRIHDMLRKIAREVGEIQGTILLSAHWIVKNAINMYKDRAIQKGISIDELFQSGSAHLVRLMKTYDWRAQARFTTYANRDTLSHIRDQVMAGGRQLRMSPDAATRADKVRSARQRFKSERGREPTASELFTLTGIPVETIRELIFVTGEEVSLQRTVDAEDGGAAYAEVIADDNAVDPSEDLQRRERHESLDEAWKKLPWQTRFILGSSFGVFQMPRLPDALVAQRLHCSLAQLARERQMAVETLKRMVKRRTTDADARLVVERLMTSAFELQDEE